MVWLGTAELPLGPGSSEVGEMRDVRMPFEGSAQLLRERLHADGYLLLRGLIPAEAVRAGCKCITDEMGKGGWFVGDPAERIARAGGPARMHPDDAAFATTNGTMLRPSEARAVSNAADGAVQRVLEAPELHAAFALLFDEPAVTLDYKWFRAVPPSANVGAATNCFHCDKVYMGRGSRRLTTAWIPWHVITPEDGGLAVLRGSSSLDGFELIRRTYAEHDVSNTDIESAAGGAYGSDPLELLARDSLSQWLTTTYRPGDVLLFTMTTMHGPLTASRSHPPRIRLSTDTRWQPARDPVDDRHTVGLGPDDALWVKHGVHGLDWARDSKALNPHTGPCRTMVKAKQDWGLLPKL